MSTILHSTLDVDGDLRMTARLALDILTILQDTSDIIDTPYIVNLGSVSGFGSDTMQVGFAGLANDHLSATAAENTDVPATGLTDSSVSIAVVRHALRRDISDLAELTSRGGSDISVNTLANSLVTAARLGVMDDIAAAIDSFSSAVGSTGVDLSVDTFMSAIYQLEISSVPGPFCALLAPRALADLQESIRSETGPTQYIAATQEMLQIKGQGYAGSFAGVDVFTSAYIDATAADVKSGMWGTGAIGWATGRVPPPRANTAFANVNDWLAIEFDRDASAATSEVVAHGYWGVAVLEDARGVEILSDAP